MLGEMGTYGSMVDGTSFEALNLRECQRTFFDLFLRTSGEAWVSRSESHREVGASAEEHGAAQKSDMANLEVRGKSGRNGYVWVHGRRD